MEVTMKLNILFFSSMIIFLINVVWFDQIRTSKSLKKRVFRKPYLVLYLILTPVMMALSLLAIPDSFFFLAIFSMMGLLFSYSHIRFALFHPGKFSLIMPLSLVHMIAGFVFFTFSVTKLFV